MDLARIQQQDLALSIRKREVELEQERRRTAAIELAALKSQRETLEKRIEYARKTVLASFDVSDRGIVPNPQKLPASLQRAKRLRENMLKRLLMYRGDFKNYIADGTALNFFVDLCGSSAFASEFYQAARKGRAGTQSRRSAMAQPAREGDPHQSPGSGADPLSARPCRAEAFGTPQRGTARHRLAGDSALREVPAVYRRHRETPGRGLGPAAKQKGHLTKIRRRLARRGE